MSTEALRQHYVAYISAINAGHADQLDDFVDENVLYNGQPLTKDEYQHLITDSQEAIPNLYFEIQMLVVGNNEVGCRLHFPNVTLQKEFLGQQPSGKSISFSEHVFYKFREGKIYEVWSLLDERAVAAGIK